MDCTLLESGVYLKAIAPVQTVSPRNTCLVFTKTCVISYRKVLNAFHGKQHHIWFWNPHNALLKAILMVSRPP